MLCSGASPLIVRAVTCDLDHNLIIYTHTVYSVRCSHTKRTTTDDRKRQSGCVCGGRVLRLLSVRSPSRLSSMRGVARRVAVKYRTQRRQAIWSVHEHKPCAVCVFLLLCACHSGATMRKCGVCAPHSQTYTKRSRDARHGTHAQSRRHTYVLPRCHAMTSDCASIYKSSAYTEIYSGRESSGSRDASGLRENKTTHQPHLFSVQTHLAPSVCVCVCARTALASRWSSEKTIKSAFVQRAPQKGMLFMT